jgi:hypothetical protein
MGLDPDRRTCGCRDDEGCERGDPERNGLRREGTAAHDAASLVRGAQLLEDRC